MVCRKGAIQRMTQASNLRRFLMWPAPKVQGKERFGSKKVLFPRQTTYLRYPYLFWSAKVINFAFGFKALLFRQSFTRRGLPVAHLNIAPCFRMYVISVRANREEGRERDKGSVEKSACALRRVFGSSNNCITCLCSDDRVIVKWCYAAGFVYS